MILASRELFKDLSRRWVEIARTESIEAPASREPRTSTCLRSGSQQTYRSLAARHSRVNRKRCIFRGMGSEGLQLLRLDAFAALHDGEERQDGPDGD